MMRLGNRTSVSCRHDRTSIGSKHTENADESFTYPVDSFQDYVLKIYENLCEGVCRSPVGGTNKQLWCYSVCIPLRPTITLCLTLCQRGAAGSL